MPTNTKVHRLVEKLKRDPSFHGNPYAVAQSVTHQSFATGKKLSPLRGKKGKRKR